MEALAASQCAVLLRLPAPLRLFCAWNVSDLSAVEKSLKASWTVSPSCSSALIWCISGIGHIECVKGGEAVQGECLLEGEMNIYRYSLEVMVEAVVSRPDSHQRGVRAQITLNI